MNGLMLSLTLLVLLPGGASSIAADTQAATGDHRVPGPNIVYILADDLGPGDVSCINSNAAWKTPNIDRLAREGRLFTDAHASCAVCTPSRYTLLTGRYSWRGALKAGVLDGYDRSLIESNRVTVASFLRAQGYTTAMIGKWHLGLDWQSAGPKPQDVDFTKSFGGGPTAHGFDTFFGISASLDMPPYVFLVNDRAADVPADKVGDNPAPKMWRAGPISRDFKFEEVHPRFEEKALSFINDHANKAKSKPFFLYVALASPHTPVLPSPAFAGKTATLYGDFVAQVDATVGKIIAALDHHGFTANTLVIFTSDNGFAPAADLTAHQKINHDPSAGYRGHKADLFEGGHRIPFIARWPGQVPANSRCSATIGQVDLLATCADILGESVPATVGEDSVSILPLLRGGNEAPARTALVHQSSNGSFAIRQGPWKLLFTPDSGGWSFPRPNTKEARNLPPVQLYNLSDDPAEKTNLASARRDIVERLTEQMIEAINCGRTTPGPPQSFANPAKWPQAARVRESRLR